MAYTGADGELFQRDISVISRHIKNVFAEHELNEKRNLQKMQFPVSDKPVNMYSLDVIISVGYRIKPLRGTQFRIWASGILKEYLKKGFAMNDDLLMASGGETILMNFLNTSEISGHQKKFFTGKFWRYTLPVLRSEKKLLEQKKNKSSK